MPAAASSSGSGRLLVAIAERIRHIASAQLSLITTSCSRESQLRYSSGESGTSSSRMRSEGRWLLPLRKERNTSRSPIGSTTRRMMKRS